MIEFFASIIVLFNLTIIPLVVIRRIYTHVPSAFLNPLLFLVVGSYGYMTLSSAFLFEYYVPGYNYNEQQRAVTDIYSNFYTLVFFLAYCLSKDSKHSKITFCPLRLTTKLAFFFVAAISPIFIFLIAKNINSAITNYTNREISHLLWATDYEKYKVGTLNNIYMAAVSVLAWRKQNPKLFLFFLIPSIFPLMFNGKGDPLKFLIFAYINIVCINKKPYFVPVGLVVMTVFCTSIFRLREDYGIATILLGEFVGPRFSTDIVFYEMQGEGNIRELLTFPVYSLLPGKISSIILPQHENYVSMLAQKINIGWHIMGSPLGEVLYYSGKIMALVAPLVVAIIFFALNQMKLHRTLPGFIFLIFLGLHIHLMMREGFFQHLLTIVYLMFSYLIWITIPEGYLRRWKTGYVS